LTILRQSAKQGTRTILHGTCYNPTDAQSREQEKIDGGTEDYYLNSKAPTVSPGGQAGRRQGGGEDGPRRRRGWPAAGRLAGGGRRRGWPAAGRRVGGWEMERLAGSGEPRRTSRLGAADDEGEHGEGDEQGRRAEELWRQTRAQRHKIPFPTPIFPAPVRGSAIFPARCSFSRRWSVSRLLDRAGTNFRAILRVLRSITRRRVITRTITRDERLNGRLMGNRRADPRVARNID